MSIYGNVTNLPMTPFVFDGVYEGEKGYNQMLADVQAGQYFINRYLLWKWTSSFFTGSKVYRVINGPNGLHVEEIACFTPATMEVNTFDYKAEGLDITKPSLSKNFKPQDEITNTAIDPDDYTFFLFDFYLQSVGKMGSDILDTLFGHNEQGTRPGYDETWQQKIDTFGGTIGALNNLMGKVIVNELPSIEEADFNHIYTDGSKYYYVVSGSEPNKCETTYEYNDNHILYENSLGVYKYVPYENSMTFDELYYVDMSEKHYAEITEFNTEMQGLYTKLLEIKRLIDNDNSVVPAENPNTVEGCLKIVQRLVNELEIFILKINTLLINTTYSEDKTSATINISIDSEKDGEIHTFTAPFTLKSDGSIQLTDSSNENEILISAVGEKKLDGNIEIFGVDNTIDQNDEKKLIKTNIIQGNERVNSTIRKLFLKYSFEDGLNLNEFSNTLATLKNTETGLQEIFPVISFSIEDQKNVCTIDITNSSISYTFFDTIEYDTAIWQTTERQIKGGSVEGYSNRLGKDDIDGQKVIGRYNNFREFPNALFAIGNGSSPTSRSNALTLFENGASIEGVHNEFILMDDMLKGAKAIGKYADYIYPHHLFVVGNGEETSPSNALTIFSNGASVEGYQQNQQSAYLKLPKGGKVVGSGAKINQNNLIFVVGNGDDIYRPSNAFAIMKNGAIIEGVGNEIALTTNERSSEEKLGKHIMGQYSKADEDALFIIGNGDSTEKRYNAFTVYKNGSSAEGIETVVDPEMTGQKIVGWYNDTSKKNVLFAVGNGAAEEERSNALTVYENGDVELNPYKQLNMEPIYMRFGSKIGDDSFDSQRIKISDFDNKGNYYYNRVAIIDNDIYKTYYKINGNQFIIHGTIEASHVTRDGKTLISKHPVTEGFLTQNIWCPVDWKQLIMKINGLTADKFDLEFYNINLVPLSHSLISTGIYSSFTPISDNVYFKYAPILTFRPDPAFDTNRGQHARFTIEGKWIIK